MKKKITDRKRSGRIRKRMAAGMLMVFIGCMAAGGASGCGRPSAWKPSGSTQDLTGQYRSKAKDYRGEAITDSFRQSYMDFSLRLLLESRNLARDSGSNLLMSPLSVMTALEMTRSGAQGKTQEQMAETLYGKALPEEIKGELMAYLQTLPNQEKAVFHFANSIWYQQEDAAFEVNPDFLKNSAVDYGAEIYGAPFDESTLKDINSWVEQETDGMIPNILDRISQDTIMYLINGMAFDAEWENKYNTDQIHEAEFYPQEGEHQTVEMMYSTENLVLRGESVKGFIKPYQESYGFAALLPEEGISIDEYLEGLTGEALMELLEQAREETVEVGLPKFSDRETFELKQVLEAMGMPQAFDEAWADFGGMGRYANGNIYIGQVVHSTFIEVDAKGTKAGAATVVGMEAGGAAIEPERVILDRPFLYAIVDMKEKLPIFIGILDTTK